MRPAGPEVSMRWLPVLTLTLLSGCAPAPVCTPTPYGLAECSAP